MLENFDDLKFDSGGRIKCATFCEGSNSIATASDNGSLHVYRLVTVYKENSCV